MQNRKWDCFILLYCSRDSRLRHLQRQSHHKLHQRVKYNMLHVDMNKLISKEPPNLLSPGGIVDEERTDRSLTGEDGVSNQTWDVVTVQDVEYYLKNSLNSGNNTKSCCLSTFVLQIPGFLVKQTKWICELPEELRIGEWQLLGGCSYIGVDTAKLERQEREHLHLLCACDKKWPIHCILN